jgi:taurine--2-oxoglutarate transaminase
MSDGPESSLTRRQSSRVFYTWTAQSEAAPVVITGGSGARFDTEDGASWIDFGSMVWNAHLGHGHPVMKRALAEAAGRGLVTMPSAVFPDKLRAAELLLEVVPRGMAEGKVFFCLSGAEANENAVKMARLVTGRRKVVYRTRSYHGATLGMLSLSGDPRRLPFDPGIPGGVPWEDPYRAVPHPGDLEAVLAAEGPQTVAAVMLEGVVGANGVFVPPPGYFRRIREICDRHGVLFIADEVLSGFGRTGRWFAVDHDQVAPDLLTLAKGLTAGYAPGGAVVAGPAVARYFDDHLLSCGLTAYAHPLTCAAIAAAIAVYRDDDLIARAARLGDWLKGRLTVLAAERRFIRELRGLGLLWALELEEPPAAGATAAAVGSPASPGRMKALKDALHRRHLHLHKRDNLIFLAPPLVSSEADLQAGLSALGEALDESFR